MLSTSYRVLCMKTLFDTTILNRVQFRNRFVRSATWEALADEQGIITEELLDIYKKLADGQVGLIITGGAFVLPDGKASPGMLGIHDDVMIEGLKRLADGVHHHGGRIVAQLGYGGTQSTYYPDISVYSPSDVPEKSTGRAGKEMTAEDFIRLKRTFAAAAQRAKIAGFDGVQIHACHGYLLSQFLTPYHNHRTDKYGGSIQNRARLILEIYEEIRFAVGKDFLIMAKLNCEDFIDQGMVLSDSLYVCKELAQRGIDALEISGGIAAAKENNALRTRIHTPEQEAYFAQYASSIAKEVNVPIILAGGLRSIEVIDHLLQNTDIAYFSLSRPLMAEPDLIKQWQEGRTDKALCLSCNRCITGSGNFCTVYGYNRQ